MRRQRTEAQEMRELGFQKGKEGRDLAAQASKSGEGAKIAECLWHERSDSWEFGCAIFAVPTAKDCRGGLRTGNELQRHRMKKMVRYR